MDDAPKRRPWWAAALIGGVGAGLAIAAALPHNEARADDGRLARIEAKLNEVAERLARMEGRFNQR